MRKKVTVLLSTSLAWPAWAGGRGAELFSQPGTNFFAQPCTKLLSYRDTEVGITGQSNTVAACRVEGLKQWITYMQTDGQAQLSWTLKLVLA